MSRPDLRRRTTAIAATVAAGTALAVLGAPTAPATASGADGRSVSSHRAMWQPTRSFKCYRRTGDLIFAPMIHSR